MERGLPKRFAVFQTNSMCQIGKRLPRLRMERRLGIAAGNEKISHRSSILSLEIMQFTLSCNSRICEVSLCILS